MDNIKNLSLRELKDQARKANINIQGLSRCSIEYKLEKAHTGKSPSRKVFKMMNKLGIKGKEGLVTEVKARNGRVYAKKQFRKNKSSEKISAEVEFQRRASSAGVSPKIKEYDLNHKFIIMRKLDTNLFDILKKRRGKLTQKLQREILHVFKTLDSIGIFHKDPNPLNFMLNEEDKLHIIDFGFAENIIPKKHGPTPNRDQMTLGLLLKLKGFFPGASYTILYNALKPGAKSILEMQVNSTM